MKFGNLEAVSSAMNGLANWIGNFVNGVKADIMNFGLSEGTAILMMVAIFAVITIAAILVGRYIVSPIFRALTRGLAKLIKLHHRFDKWCSENMPRRSSVKRNATLKPAGSDDKIVELF